MYYTFIKKSIMVEIAKIIRPIVFYTSGYEKESIEQLAAEIDMSGQSDDITITEDGVLIDGWRRCQALLLLGHTHVRATVVKIEEQNIRQLMLSLNFTRDKKNFEKYKEASCIYKNVERHQGKKTTSSETPAQIAIRISGAEMSESNFHKFIYIERIQKLLPNSNLIASIEKGDLTINKVYQIAQRLKQEEDERLRLLASKQNNTGLADLTKTTKGRNANTDTVPDNIISTTGRTATIETIRSSETDIIPKEEAIEYVTPSPRIIAIPRKHTVLSPKCHIINESNWNMEEIPDNYIDMSIQSPPYWQMITYGNTNELGQEKTPEEYLDKLLKTYEALYPKMKDSGNLLVNFKGSFKLMAHWNIEQWFVIRMGQLGWYLKDTLIWERGVGKQSGRFDRGPENCYEPIFWFVKSKDYYFAPYAKKVREKAPEISVKNVTRNEGSGITNYQKIFINRAIKSFVNVIHENEFWNIITTDASRFEAKFLTKYYGEHPAPFPLCFGFLPALEFCPPNGVVLDCFMGRGAGLLASLILGHTVYGYEVNEKHFETSKKLFTDVLTDIDLYQRVLNEALAA